MQLRQAFAERAPGESLEALEQTDERERDRERCECEVRTGEPRRRDAEREADGSGDETAERDRPEVAPVVVDDEDRRRIGTEPHERTVAERDLPGEAGEQVE